MPEVIRTLKKINSLDKLLVFTTFLVPIFLAISIFVADLLASLSGVILIYIFLTKKDLFFFKSIRNEIIFFFFFYLIIILSLLLSEFKTISFLPSFFYFRYFLLSLSVFYLLKKYDSMINVLAFFVLVTIGIVLFDATFQYFTKYNIFGYELIGISTIDPLIYLTSFFNEEKKLGSYIVRSLPLVLSILFFLKPKNLSYISIVIFLYCGSIIYFASERTALFLFLILTFFYFIVLNKKKFFLILFGIIILLILNSSDRLKDKYFNYTAEQIQINNFLNQDYDQNKLVRFYSEEHENLAYTAIKLFKKKIFFGNGVKSFYHGCTKLINQVANNDNLENFSNSKRNNKLICSTHPHSTYLQIMSDVGIFGFLMIIFVFILSLISNIKFLLKKKTIDHHGYSFYLINLSLILNLMPLIPSGNFFNNWLSLITYFSLGFWLFLKSDIKKK